MLALFLKYILHLKIYTYLFKASIGCKVLHSVFYPPSACDGQGWVEQEPGAYSGSPHEGARAQALGPFSTAFSWAISRWFDWKWSSLDLNPYEIQISQMAAFPAFPQNHPSDPQLLLLTFFRRLFMPPLRVHLETGFIRILFHKYVSCNTISHQGNVSEYDNEMLLHIHWMAKGDDIGPGAVA